MLFLPLPGRVKRRLSAGRNRGYRRLFPISSRPHSEAGDRSVTYFILIPLLSILYSSGIHGDHSNHIGGARDRFLAIFASVI